MYLSLFGEPGGHTYIDVELWHFVDHLYLDLPGKQYHRLFWVRYQSEISRKKKGAFQSSELAGYPDNISAI